MLDTSACKQAICYLGIPCSVSFLKVLRHSLVHSFVFSRARGKSYIMALVGELKMGTGSWNVVKGELSRNK
jgi:hypothetical protein